MLVISLSRAFLALPHRRLAIIAMVWTTGISGAVAQENQHPWVGKPLPAFTITEVDNYSKHTISSDDFRNEWLVIECWGRHCLTCLKTIPKMGEMQSRFGDSINFILVGETFGGSLKATREMYNRLATKYSLTIPSAYDSTLFLTLGLKSVPQMIIIGPDGIIRGLAPPSEFDYGTFERLLLGQDYFANEKRYATGEESTTERDRVASVMERWVTGDSLRINPDIMNMDNGAFHATGMSPERLYKLAYFGKSDWNFNDAEYLLVSKSPILESDSQRSLEELFKTERYNYWLRLPEDRRTKPEMMKAMQLDLQKIFGHVASIERRPVRCWKLVTADGNYKRLRAKGDKTHIVNTYAGVTLVNGTVRDLLRAISLNLPGFSPLIDQTGITFPITIELKGLMFDMDEVKKELQMNGLDLIESQVEMNVLVIKDKTCSP